MLYNEHEALTPTGRRIEAEVEDFVVDLIEKHPGIPIREIMHIVVDCATRAERKAVIVRALTKKKR